MFSTPYHKCSPIRPQSNLDLTDNGNSKTSLHAAAPPLLSVVVITRNEAQNLPRLLESVREIADEIIVFDSGSTDGTVGLAEQAGARVVNCAWEGWSATKNKANAAATGQWVLSLDADEAPDAACSAAIKRHMEGGIQTASGAWRIGEVNRMTNYCGHWVRHSGWFPDRKVRLWPRGTAHWQGAIHELPVFDQPTVITRLAGVVQHFSYPQRADHLSQIEKFGSAWARDKFALGYAAPRALVLLKVAAQWAKTFVLKRGFLDGHTGWTIARLSAWATWRKHAHLRELHRNQPWAPRRVLISRTDALGDLVLTLPMVAALRARHPDIAIDLLVRPYAAPLAQTALGVNRVIRWDEEAAGDARGQGAELMRSGQYDAAVLAFPDRGVLAACRKARIPIRIGTGRRWHSFFGMTHPNWDGRRDSGGHEAWHGLRLLQPFGIEPGDAFRSAVYLQAPDAGVKVEEALKAMGKPPILLHPGSHGSAGNWPQQCFAELALLLAQCGEVVGFTGTEAEGRAFADAVPQHHGIVPLFGKFDLKNLLALQSRASVVVASSTGPLHTATAMGTPGIGLYGTTPPEWDLRWAPIGPHVTVISTARLKAHGCLDISVEEVFETVLPVKRQGGAE